MTTRARSWRCRYCGWRYRSPVPVMAVLCPNHAGRGREMEPEEDEGE